MKFVLQIADAIGDLVVRIFPQNKIESQYRFAFLVHPRNRADVQRKYPVFKFIPSYVTDVFTKYFWPVTLSKITGLKSLKSNEEIEGYVISILPTAHQMFENRSLALKRITQACILAKKKGAKIVGLGGLTSSFSKGGLDLLDQVGINITTGHAYTSFNVTQNVFAISKYMSLDKKKVCVGVVGAAGSVGSTSAKLIAREGYMRIVLIDVERKKHFFEDLINEMKSLNPIIHIETSHQIGDIKTCDIVIAATNAPEALIRATDLKWGAIIVDDAQPSDVHLDVFEREDVLVIEAGVTFTPNIKSNFNFGLKDRQDNFCCLAEVFILAANEWGEHYVINRASLDLVDEVAKLGEKLNFRIGNFQNFRESISTEKLSYVKNCIKQNELSA